MGNGAIAGLRWLREYGNVGSEFGIGGDLSARVVDVIVRRGMLSVSFHWLRCLLCGSANPAQTIGVGDGVKVIPTFATLNM